jgi:DNA-directed RNA polymerase subunit beta
MARIWNWLNAMERFKRKVVVDDIDHLKNRRVKTCGELLQNQFQVGLDRLQTLVRFKVSREESLSVKRVIDVKALDTAWREFFGSNPLSQYMDQTNPLAEITHKRRVSCLGPEG